MEPHRPVEGFAGRYMRTQRTQRNAVGVPYEIPVTVSLIDLFQRIHETTLLHDILVEEALVTLAGMSEEFHNVPLTIMIKTAQDSQLPCEHQLQSDSANDAIRAPRHVGRLALVMAAFFFCLVMLIYLIIMTTCDDNGYHEFICSVHDFSFKITFQ